MPKTNSSKSQKRTQQSRRTDTLSPLVSDIDVKRLAEQLLPVANTQLAADSIETFLLGALTALFNRVRVLEGEIDELESVDFATKCDIDNLAEHMQSLTTNPLSAFISIPATLQAMRNDYERPERKSRHAH